MTRVNPQELGAVATELTAAATALGDALVHSDEPSMGYPEPYGEVMFGPAVAVASQYARLTHALAGHVKACEARLREGAAVFAKAAVEFPRIDTGPR